MADNESELDELEDVGFDTDEDERLWADVRSQFIDRLTCWVDTVGQTEAGRCQIADVVDQFDQATDQTLPTGFGETYEVIHETLGGMSQIVGDLTALRHDLKSQTKSNRSLIEQVAGDTERIVSMGDKMIHKLESIPMASERDQIRPYISILTEADESVLRMRDAIVGLLSQWPSPPEPEQPWFGKAAITRNHAAWESRWREQQNAVSGLAEGLRMTVERLTELLKKNQIERVGIEGEAFDSAAMQVLEVIETTEVAPGTIVKVLRKGYRHGNWIVRPAQVSTARTT